MSYSLNVPLPAAVGRLASDLARDLPGARARVRGEHTLVCKRLGEGPYGRLEAKVRDAVTGTPAFEARVSGVDCFSEAATGPSPVVYLTVESPELRRLHDRLCTRFDPAEGIEGEAYVPHVTVARGGSLAAAEELTEREIAPITWTVEELLLYDAERGQAASRLSLPA